MKTFQLLKAVVFGLSVTLTVNSGAAAAETATNLFARHFAAAGGLEEFAKIDTVIVRGTGRERTETFQFELCQKKPGCMLLVISNGTKRVARMARDGQARFWQENPEMGLGDIPKERQGGFMELGIGLFPPALRHFSAALAQGVCKEVDRDGRTFIAIGEAGRDNVYPQLMFDKASGLLARISRVELDDYRLVKGIKLPFRIKPDERSEFQVEQVELNTPLDDSIFNRPGQSTTPVGAAKAVDNYPTLVSQPGKLQIVRQPAPMQFGRGKIKSIPPFDPSSPQPWQVDLRGTDLRGVDLSQCASNLLHADFDSGTQWPAAIPSGFDRDNIMLMGKDPGLGIRKLHKKGIEGRGISIGIIDQALLVDHIEYADRLKLYEEIHCPASVAQMHGPAVASIAVGKTVGVAPKADLYYIAETHGVFRNGGFDWDFTWLAKAIDRLLEVNSTLPADKRIRVISISVGWSPEQKGFKETMAAVDRATKANVFVISTAIEATHKLAFHGLGRDGMADPNEFNSFAPGSWWATMFWSGQMRFQPGDRLLVPMDSRTTASPTGPNDYVFYSSGGWSWSVPWVAGLYALACEVKPDITPQEFWSQSLRTGRTITVHHDGKEFPFGTIADPVALIESLQGKH